MPSVVRDLRGVIERENASIGVLITLKESTKGMRKEAAEAGFYTSPLGRKYPRLQILTIEELFEGKVIDRPGKGSSVDATFDKAERHVGEEQKEMF